MKIGYIIKTPAILSSKLYQYEVIVDCYEALFEISSPEFIDEDLRVPEHELSLITDIFRI